VRVTDFHFDLPESLIAQSPPAIRGASRMLVLDRATGRYRDDFFRSLPEILRPDDLLILNDSRVIPARLYATRAGLRTQHNSPDPTGRIEVLLTQQLTEHDWKALVRPSRKVVPGEKLLFHASGEAEPVLQAEVTSAGEFGERTLRFAPAADFNAILNKIGHMPLPPYIHRDDSEEDRDRYQTVYSQAPGSAAAPTAGLHFTPEIIDSIRQRGVKIETVTLHVGLGTFQPVRGESLHAERFYVNSLNEAKIRASHRVIAAGTTSVRAVESLYLGKSGETDLFIKPGFTFQRTGAMLTNFHLPESSLLMLVCAFAGRESVLAAYEHAVQAGYRFYSYGDCMLIV
jgi:S-adenosylmethionine:tRNA ribosyltransferase-isomerase